MQAATAEVRVTSFARLVPLLALSTACGCGTVLRSASTEVPRAATPVVIDETLRMLEDPETRRRIAAVLASPEVKASIDGLASNLANGALEGLTSDEAKKLLEELAGTVAAAFSRAAGKGVEAEIAPAITRAIRASVAEAFGPEQRKALAEQVSSATVAVTRDVSRTLGAELPPAMMKAITLELQRPEVRDKLGVATERAARNVILGSADAVRDIQSQSGAPSLRQELTRALTALAAISVLLGAVVVGLGAWIFAVNRRAKHYREQRDRQQRVAQRFITMMASTRGKPYADDLYRTYQAQLESGEGAEELRMVLAQVGATPLHRPRPKKRRRGPPPHPREPHRSEPGRRSSHH